MLTYRVFNECWFVYSWLGVRVGCKTLSSYIWLPFILLIGNLTCTLDAHVLTGILGHACPP